MKRLLLFTSMIVSGVLSVAQTVQQRMQSAVTVLLQEDKMKHASMSVYVVESATGKVVYHFNEQTGLAPASTQKIFTSIACFDLLGKDFRFKTDIGYDGTVSNGVLKGNLYITGYGDPTFGSFRYASTQPEQLGKAIITALDQAGINAITGNLILDNSRFSYQPLPGGWIWDDIGNYYGAGTWALNWNENQYDLVLRPGKKEGDPVDIVDTPLAPGATSYINLLKTATPGSGDNGYIYLPPYSTNAFVTGTEGYGNNTIKIAGSIPNPAFQISRFFEDIFNANNLSYKGQTLVLTEANKQGFETLFPRYMVSTVYSPPFDSVNYWFLQKSINFYGEALTKTLAYEQTNLGSTTKGVEVLRDFWSAHGIEKSALNICDGSGLSPQNRVTTESMVKALQYARTRPWFSSFYNALPVYNGMKMKSGTIAGAKAFTGYHTSHGTSYTFAIIINNFDDTTGSIIPAMYKILDQLK